MEKIFFVKNGDFSEVNKSLLIGAKVKQIIPIAERIVPRLINHENDADFFAGNIYAYVVVELD
jgi:hypothetical protein